MSTQPDTGTDKDVETVRRLVLDWNHPNADAVSDVLDRLAPRLAAAEARAERAEAAMREVLDEYGDYEEFDPLRRVLGLPLYDSPEAWYARGAAEPYLAASPSDTPAQPQEG